MHKNNYAVCFLRENRKKRLQKTAKIGHRNEQIARTFKWFTGCVKFDKEKKLCNNCGACDLCDLDATKYCDNCGKCLKMSDEDFYTIEIDEIISDKDV